MIRPPRWLSREITTTPGHILGMAAVTLVAGIGGGTMAILPPVIQGLCGGLIAVAGVLVVVAFASRDDDADARHDPPAEPSPAEQRRRRKVPPVELVAPMPVPPSPLLGRSYEEALGRQARAEMIARRDDCCEAPPCSPSCSCWKAAGDLPPPKTTRN